MLIKKKISIADTFLFNMMVLTIFSTLIMAYFWVAYEHSRFKKETQKIKEEYIAVQKKYVQHHVKNIISGIEFYQSHAVGDLKTVLEKQATKAWNIAENIYTQYKDKEPPKRIYERIISIFNILKLDGVWIQDSSGHLIINLNNQFNLSFAEKQKKIFQDQDSGFIQDWLLEGASEDQLGERITYVKKLKSLGWVIGSTAFVKNSVINIQKKLLQCITNIKVENNGYIFIYDYDGLCLMSNYQVMSPPINRWNLEDPNGLKVIQELRKTAQLPNGGFIHYFFAKPGHSNPLPKVSFVSSIPKWRWLVGAGVYLDEIDKVIEEKKTELKAEVILRIQIFIVILITQCLLILIIAKYISYKAKVSFKIFTRFFSRASQEFIQIDPEQLHFSEFSQLADAANQMILDRGAAQKAFIESEGRLKQTIEATNDGIWDWEFKTGRAYFSPRYYTMAGYEPDEFLPSYDAWTSRVHPEDLPKALEAIQAHLDGKTDFYKTEFRFRTKNKEWLWIMGRGKVVQRDEDGKPIRLIGTHVDINAQKQVEKALEESEETYRNLFQNAQVGLFRTSPLKGFVLECNDALARMFGYDSREECIQDYYLPDAYVDKGAREKMIALAQKYGEFKNYEARFRRKDGKIMWLRYSGKYYPEKEWLEGVGEDITERKKALEEKKKLQEKLNRSKKMEALGLLAGGVAHDLNNILSGIVSYPDLLLMELPQDSPLRGPLTIIYDAGQRAAAVVSDLLTVARGIASPREVKNLNLLVQEYLDSPEHQTLINHHAHVTVQLKLENELLNTLCSPVHVKKSLMNLISNACEAIDQNGKVIISTKNQYIETGEIAKGEYAVLRVSDNGLGISSESIDRIFEPFYTKKVMGRSGTGLGLAVVWNAMQDHKGYVQVESSENGTVFTLYFPATRKISEQHKPIYNIENYCGNGEQILVVDDEASQREIACRILTSLKYQAASASGCEEAVNFLKKTRVDLIVLDMMMEPGPNGRETYEEILKIQPGQKAIIASGFAENEEVKKAQALGVGQYIKKPYTLEKIGLAVYDALKDQINK